MALNLRPKISPSKRKYLYLLIPGFVILYSLWPGKRDEATLTATVAEGEFNIRVQTTGEIKAKTQTDIDAPGNEMQQAGLWNGIKIQDLIPEGTRVKAGEFVATLDKTPLMTKLQEVALELDKKESELKQTRLDTAITLRDARDELLNLKSAVEEAKLEVEQSAYEAPAIQQQKRLALEKAERNLLQKRENYQTKVAQAATKVAIINADLSKAQNSFNRVNDLLGKMDVKAPKDGMVVYVKNWNGRKKTAGSNVSPWEPAVATLPDLRELQVITYVSEVDVRKVKPGQEADITLDAEPDKKLKGVVVQVANIGEQRPNQESKVFEVLIDILNPDSTLRPAMTTSNIIHIDTYKKVLSVPLEALNTQKSLNYVWLKKGNSILRQEVLVGAMNEKDALVYQGLELGEEVLLSAPPDTTGLDLRRIEKRLEAPKPFVDAEKQKKLQEHIQKSKATAATNAQADGGMMVVIE